jgi:hypothetical protein
MNYFLLTVGLLLSSTSMTFAGTPVPCEPSSTLLNTVESMRKFSNGSVKVFELDNIEPAGAPVSVAVTVDRGETLDTQESFCVNIPYLYSANVRETKSSYSKMSGILTLKIPVTKMDEAGAKVSFSLVVKVAKHAKTVTELITFEGN